MKKKKKHRLVVNNNCSVGRRVNHSAHVIADGTGENPFHTRPHNRLRVWQARYFRPSTRRSSSLSRRMAENHKCRWGEEFKSFFFFADELYLIADQQLTHRGVIIDYWNGRGSATGKPCELQDGECLFESKLLWRWLTFYELSMLCCCVFILTKSDVIPDKERPTKNDYKIVPIFKIVVHRFGTNDATYKELHSSQIISSNWTQTGQNCLSYLNYFHMFNSHSAYYRLN